MSKSKAGKKKAVKRAPRKSARKATPAASPAAKALPKFPCLVHVKKGADILPVQVADEAHYQRLVTEYGESHVEVQS